jgi:hypothetical protein
MRPSSGNLHRALGGLRLSWRHRLSAAPAAVAVASGGPDSGAEQQQQQHPRRQLQTNLRPPPAFPRPISRFCRQCGGAMAQRTPPGDDKVRSVCAVCDCVDYFNPRVVVGAIVEHDGKVLLCRRGIEPQRGLWTVRFPCVCVCVCTCLR